MKHKTHREFVVVADEDRYFDGNASGELTIDEYVTLNTVSLEGIVYTTGTSLTMDNVVEVSQATYPKNRIQVFRGSFPVLSGLYYDQFPAGRGNVKVNADWGYGATIPKDLWEAFRDYMAYLMMVEIIAGGSAQNVVGFTVADESERYSDRLPGEAQGWPTRFDQRIKEYTKPTRRVISRAWSAPVI